MPADDNVEIVRMTYRIRPLTHDDNKFLKKILYHAIYVAPGDPLPEPGIVEQPLLSRYVASWGKEGDVGFAAIETALRRPIGAAWLRLLAGDDAGYGYIDDETPEMSVALLPGYRGMGIGSVLLTHLFQAARGRYDAVSLSVTPENPACRLYQRLGFEVVGKSGNTLVMKKSLAASPD